MLNSQPIPAHLLSKSSFVNGCQCAKSLWLNKHDKDLAEETSEEQQVIFDRGKLVGELARQLFPGGIDASPIDHKYQEAVLKTQKLIQEGAKVIYEASFQFDRVLIIADIIVKEKGTWKLYEVKSGTEIQDVHYIDTALQWFVVVNQSGIKLSDIFIVHVNNEYVRKGELNLEKLFIKQSVKKEVLERQKEIPSKIAELKSVVSSKKVPDVKIGDHCGDPYPCPYISFCWKHIPEVSVFNLLRMRGNKKWELYEQGIIEFSQIPEDYQLSDGQRMQVESYLKQKTFVDKNAIREFVNEIESRRYFMDFETFQYPIPLFDNVRPYQQILFQYSLHHKSSKKSKLYHSEFLAQANGDTRIPFIESLLDATMKPGSILIYSSFEITHLNILADTFPKYRNAIEELIDRTVDLMKPFQKRWYYTPEMNGSHSIKVVLPALIPDLSYDNMDIADGNTASINFASLFNNTDTNKTEKIRKDLKEYCKLDTFAMVRLLEHLEQI